MKKRLRSQNKSEMFLNLDRYPKDIRIKFDRFDQKIVVGEHIIDKFISEIASRKYSKIVLFIDKFVRDNHKEKVDKIINGLAIKNIISFTPSEAVKSLKGLGRFVGNCHNFGLNRRGCILGIGGGVTGDAGGFLASIYMRGVDFAYLPTTIMSQADSVIGKVGIAYKNIKNILGSFYSPAITYCDTSFIQSLGDEDIKVGMSEIVKNALVASPSFIRFLEKNIPNNECWREKFNWNEVVFDSLKIKAKLVEKDPYDVRGIQKGLSYGHTIANVLEGTGGFHFRHGHAVALGMRVAGEISYQMGILSEVDRYKQETLLNAFGSIEKIPFKIEPEPFIETLKRDKLSTNNKINLVLLEKIGKFIIQKDVDENIAIKALMKYSA